MREDIVIKDRVSGLCSNCEKKTELEVITKEEVIKVRKEPTKVEIQFCRCTQCGDEVFDPNLNQDPVDLAYRAYRRNHGLLQPEEIKDWRKAHKLTQGELAKLLGLGKATISRYENGTLQDEPHEKLLRLAMDPANLLKLIYKSENVFTELRKKSLVEALREAEADSHSIDDTIILNFGSYGPDEFSGYRKLDLEKLYNAILFFCKEGVFKTKLNKLLFYADFKHFKEYAVPITGAQYAHIPFGPAPDYYGFYYDSLYSKGAIEFIEWEGTSEDLKETIVGEIIKSKKEPGLSLFSTSELRVMASVKEYFEGYSSKAITDFSHKEKGYLETEDGDTISYSYAKQLNC